MNSKVVSALLVACLAFASLAEAGDKKGDIIILGGNGFGGGGNGGMPAVISSGGKKRGSIILLGRRRRSVEVQETAAQAADEDPMRDIKVYRLV